MGLAFRSTLARAAAGARRFVSALSRDARGNTLVIVGIAMIPLTAMIGSGVDMARGYMAQARMQQACDAGALAGRRAMTDGTVNQAVKDEAQKFFKFNFKTGTNGVAGTAAYGAKGFTPVVSAASDNASTVVITGTTTIPTAVMKMFGHMELTLNVTCNAKQDYVNTDVVLVLDSTGSMLCATTETSCSNSSEKTSSKIKALRTAVLALYDTLAGPQVKLEAAGLRLRYGVVPYSSGVNIGKQLREMSTNYVVSDNWTYQSRKAIWKTPDKTTTETYSSSISQSDCNLYAANNYPSSGSNPVNSTVDGYAVTTTYSLRDWGGVDDQSGTNRTCRRYKRVVGGQPLFDDWSYEPVTYNVDQYVLGNSVTTQTGGDDADDVSSTWAGCIEENQTSTSITTTSTSIPSGAKDLDINIIPSDKESKWKPYWPEVVYYPAYGSKSAGKPQVACPAESRRLQAWTKANLSTYLNTLVATGGTYHDNGMRWGARLISSGGVFGPDNPATHGNMPVSKHLIFMTDGIIDTGDTLYSAYGMERFDKRVTGGWTSDADQTGRHDARFKMLCEATKGMGVSVWVVVFASTMTTSLKNCATKGQDITTTTGAELTSAFEKIGREIGALRLTQ